MREFREHLHIRIYIHASRSPAQHSPCSPVACSRRGRSGRPGFCSPVPIDEIWDNFGFSMRKKEMNLCVVTSGAEFSCAFITSYLCSVLPAEIEIFTYSLLLSSLFIRISLTKTSIAFYRPSASISIRLRRCDKRFPARSLYILIIIFFIVVFSVFVRVSQLSV